MIGIDTITFPNTKFFAAKQQLAFMHTAGTLTLSLLCTTRSSLLLGRTTRLDSFIGLMTDSD
jgi:hypothetical protein